jgi:type IV secretory pathway VirB6-like protein
MAVATILFWHVPDCKTSGREFSPTLDFNRTVVFKNLQQFINFVAEAGKVLFNGKSSTFEVN